MNMAVEREQFGPSDVSLTGALAHVFDALIRRSDGTYTFRIRIDGEAVLPDGRRARILDRHLGVEVSDVIGRRKPLGA
jgi:hypothetical protein